MNPQSNMYGVTAAGWQKPNQQFQHENDLQHQSNVGSQNGSLNLATQVSGMQITDHVPPKMNTPQQQNVSALLPGPPLPQSNNINSGTGFISSNSPYIQQQGQSYFLPPTSNVLSVNKNMPPPMAAPQLLPSMPNGQPQSHPQNGDSVQPPKSSTNPTMPSMSIQQPHKPVGGPFPSNIPSYGDQNNKLQTSEHSTIGQHPSFNRAPIQLPSQPHLSSANLPPSNASRIMQHGQQYHGQQMGYQGGTMPLPPPQFDSVSPPQQFHSYSGQIQPNQPQYPGQQSTMPGMPHMPPPLQQMGNKQQPQMTGNTPGMQTSFPPGIQQFPMPGKPPMVGAQQAGSPGMQNRQYNQPGTYNSMGAPYPQGDMAPQPQRRLDPDQMPNPIQVMAENQRVAGGTFTTDQPGSVPPLVSTKFITHDQGNSGPRFIRSSMYNVPATADMMKQTAVPFSLIISPFARTIAGEYPPPIVDFGELGPIRCVRCKGYMSPNMQFVDAGRRFQCLLCKATTEVPTEYFQHLDHTGQRIDKYERPELVLGTYEFVATKEYCRDRKLPLPPAIIFILDVSYNNIKSGLVHLLCSEMKEIIKNLPIDQGMTESVMKVGFITYNNTVHFYNCKSSLAQPQMMVVGDVHEMFMPLLDGFLCDVKESEAVIDSLMEQIPLMFSDTRETETILLPAIQAGLEALKASECTGKLLVFHSSLPVTDVPGKLRNRDDRKLLGTEKEKTILIPQNNTYNNVGQDCVLAGCSVDLFIFNNAYIDLATIGQVCRLTGGEIYKYTYFQADLDGQRLINDIIKNISRPIAFDGIMRVRTSTGIRPTYFYGHFFMSNTTDMELASVDCDKSVAIELKHDDKLPPEENVYIQVALLYTSCSGQRRLRILNLTLKTCTQMQDLFRCCDLDAAVLFFAKQSMVKLLELTPKAVKENIENRCAQILACYRKNCASPTSAGQLILPECMKLLPLYVSCLLKNDAISGGSDMTCDDRSYVMQFVLSMDLTMSVSYFYPHLIPIHDVNPNEEDIPAPIRCTIDKMLDDGAYILENGVYMFIWLGLSLSPEFTQSVFGAQCTQQINTDRLGIPEFDNPISKRVRQIIDNIQSERPRCMKITLVRQRDKMEAVLKHFLIEDRGSDGSPSYVDYLINLHKEIRQILS